MKKKVLLILIIIIVSLRAITFASVISDKCNALSEEMHEYIGKIVKPNNITMEQMYALEDFHEGCNQLYDLLKSDNVFQDQDVEGYEKRWKSLKKVFESKFYKNNDSNTSNDNDSNTSNKKKKKAKVRTGKMNGGAKIWKDGKFVSSDELESINGQGSKSKEGKIQANKVENAFTNGIFRQNGEKFEYVLPDGNILTMGYAKFDVNGDNILDYCYFGEDGNILVSGKTVDGYNVNEKGQVLDVFGSVMCDKPQS